MIKIQVETELVTENCSKCGVLFAFSSDYQKRLRDNHETFYCPHGHSQYYPAETEVERLRKRLDSVVSERDQAITAKLQIKTQLDGTLQKLSSIEKRIQNGCCPKCHRHFVNLERHMKTKHY